MSDTLQRILVPLDGSKLAEAVLPFATILARSLDSTLVLLHVIEANAPETIHGEPHLRSVEGAEEYLQGVANRYGEGSRLDIHTHPVGESNVAQSIAEHLTELRCDAVVLCTHGRTGLRRVMSGSIAQLVLKRAQVPVVVVRPDMPAPKEIARILVPLDGTPAAESALEVAADVSGRTGAALHLVMVVATLTTVSGDRSAASRLLPITATAELNDEEQAGRDYLKSTADKLAARGVRAGYEVRRGDTVNVLSSATRDRQADLVIIATHGRSGLDALWTGSVTAGLAGKLRTPVMMIKIRQSS